MKDEEMAEEYADRTRIVDENTRAGTDCISLVQDYEGNYIDIHERIKQAFLAGLKAGRPQWHDLRENPNDLPKDEKDMLMSEQLILLTKMKGTDNINISIGQYNFSTQEFSYPHFIGLTDVIAWCEIPTFDKE